MINQSNDINIEELCENNVQSLVFVAEWSSTGVIMRKQKVATSFNTSEMRQQMAFVSVRPLLRQTDGRTSLLVWCEDNDSIQRSQYIYCLRFEDREWDWGTKTMVDELTHRFSPWDHLNERLDSKTPFYLDIRRTDVCFIEAVGLWWWITRFLSLRRPRPETQKTQGLCKSNVQVSVLDPFFSTTKKYILIWFCT